jgi:hypothetical protein
MQTSFNINAAAGNVYDVNGIYYARDRRPVSYPEKGNQDCLQLEDHSFWFRHRNNCISHLVKRFSAQKTFWDIGGGNGFVAQHLQCEGIETVLLEPGEQGAENAKKRGIKNIICGSLEDVGLKEGRIDSAGMFDVLEHIENDSTFLRQLHKSCSNEASIYITVPAYNLLWSDEDDNAGHFRRYTLRSLTTLLENCGYSVKFSTYIFSFLPLPILFFRSLPSRLGMNKNSADIEKYSKEHEAFKLSPLLDRILKWEEKKVLSLKKIAIGGSCLVVASVVKHGNVKVDMDSLR